jgi:HPt (histidine-containing phosphotransfer) domain-containing protein
VSGGEDQAIIDEPIVSQLLDLGPEVMAELIELYGQQLATLLPAVQAGDTGAAHTLKGSSANLGLAKVARLAGAIEKGTADLPGTAAQIAPAASEGLDILRSRLA